MVNGPLLMPKVPPVPSYADGTTGQAMALRTKHIRTLEAMNCLIDDIHIYKQQQQQALEERRNDNQTQQLETSQQLIQQSNAQIQNLQQELADVRKALSHMELEKIEFIHRLQAERQLKVQLEEDHRTKINHLEIQLKLMDSEREMKQELEQRSTFLETQQEILQTKIAERDATLTKLTRDIQEKDNLIHTLHQQDATKTSAHQSLQEKIRNLEDQLHAHQVAYEKSQAELIKSQHVISNYRQQLAPHEKMKAFNASLKKENNDVLSEIHLLKQEVLESKKQSKMVEESNQKLIQDLYQHRDELQLELRGMQEQFNILNTQMAQELKEKRVMDRFLREKDALIRELQMQVPNSQPSSHFGKFVEMGSMLKEKDNIIQKLRKKQNQKIPSTTTSLRKTGIFITADSFNNPK